MNEGNHISVAYIKAYLAGELSREETYSFEKELLRNSALSDAVEGFRALHEQAIELSPIQQSLQERLNQRIAVEEKKGIIPFQPIRWSAAAVLLLCCGALGYWWGFKQENPTAYNALPSVATVQKTQPKQPLHPLVAIRSKAKDVLATAPSPQDIPKVSMIKLMMPDMIAPDSLLGELLKDTLIRGEVALIEPKDAQKRNTNGVSRPDLFSLPQSNTYLFDSIISSKEVTETLALKSVLASPKPSLEMNKGSKSDESNHFSRAAIETSSSFINYDGQMPKSRVFMVNPKKQKGWQYDPANHDAQPSVSPEEYEEYLSKAIQKVKASLDVSGIVRVKFSVREDGSLAKFSIQKSINKQVDDEAIRILKEGPNWMPKINDGIVRKQWIIKDLTFN